MSSSPIQHVADTAFWVATFRALEGDRPERLFSDPLAKRLVEGRGEAIAREMPDGDVVGWSIVLRTCIIDDYLSAVIAEGCDAVLNLGAGLDTRPYRMALPPSLRWIEVDFPDTIAFKEQRLGGEAPRCQLERVQLDLSDVAARQRLFADVNGRAAKVVVLTEGVVPYLTVEQAGSLATALAEQPHFQFWIVDYFSRRFMELRKRSKHHQKLQQAPFLFEPPDWSAFFRERGWVQRQMRYLSEEGRRRGRSLPVRWWQRLLMRLAPPAVREEMTKFSGYALLERRPPAAAHETR